MAFSHRQQLIAENLADLVPVPPLQGLIGAYDYGFDNLAAFLREENIIAKKLGKMCPDIYSIEAQDLYNRITVEMGFYQERPQMWDSSRDIFMMLLEDELTTFVSDEVDTGSSGIPDIVMRHLSDRKNIDVLIAKMITAYNQDKAVLEGQGPAH